MKTKTFRFILTPLDTVFFGDEKSPFKQEYFQSSKYLPQQTGVLGLIRYEALRRAGLLGMKHDLWEKLIGAKSFNGTPDQEFGIIKEIGPVHIHLKDEMGQDRLLYPLKDPAHLEINPIDDVRSNYGDGTVELKQITLFKSGIKSYDPKERDYFELIFSDLNELNFKALNTEDSTFEKAHGFSKPLLKNIDGIFWKDLRPGITKNYKGVPNDEGFYKTEFLRMMSGFSYSFTATIAENELLGLDKWETSAVLRFGGDRSLYKMRIQEAQTLISGSGNVFILISDAMVSKNIYNHCASVVTDVQHFRNIQTESKAGEKWHKRPGYQINQEGIGSHTLLKHGSILIANGEDEARKIEEEIQNNKAFRKIGYNQFIRLTNLPKGTKI